MWLHVGCSRVSPKCNAAALFIAALAHTPPPPPSSRVESECTQKACECCVRLPPPPPLAAAPPPSLPENSAMPHAIALIVCLEGMRLRCAAAGSANHTLTVTGSAMAWYQEKFEWKGVNFGLGLLGFLLVLIGPVVISVYFIKAGSLYTAYHPEVALIDLWDTLPISQKALRDSVMCERGFDVGEDPINTTDLIRCNMEDSGLNGIRGLGAYTYPVLSLWRYVMAIVTVFRINPVRENPWKPISVLTALVTSAIIFSLFMVANVPREESGWEVRSNIPAAVWVALRVDFIISTLGYLVVSNKTGCTVGIMLTGAPLLLPLAFLLAPVGMLQYAYFEDSYWYLIAAPIHYAIGYAVFRQKPRSIAALYCATEFTLCTVLFYTLGGADRPPGSFLLPAETWSGMLFFSLISPVMLPMLICCEVAVPSYRGSNLLRLWRSPSPPRVALAATYALCAGAVLHIHVSESDSENLPFVIALFPASICFIDQLLDDPVVDMFARILRPLAACLDRIEGPGACSNAPDDTETA